MNFQQLEYVVAVQNHGSFSKAAKSCFVTQPTLSMMVQKLEEELGICIFDRSKKPIAATREGEEILHRAAHILKESNHLKDYCEGLKESISGHIRIGVIPTLAPYLLPLFLKQFTHKYPDTTLHIRELVTQEIIDNIKSDQLDLGLLATPLHENQIIEYPLFTEEFYVYASTQAQLPAKKFVVPSQIDTSELWLLEEGHCMRNQIFNLCELRRTEDHLRVHYEAGSIETLINLVDHQQGITIIPELAVRQMKPTQVQFIHEFAPPKPVRQISLISSKNYPRVRLVKKLIEEIIQSLPAIAHREQVQIIDIK